MARSTGQKYIELPAKAVFTIKPSKFKIGIVACGNKTDETFGCASTTDLDTGMVRYLVSWAASLPNFCLASLDVTAAFLNAPLPTGRTVVLRPRGFREVPSLWSEERTEALTRLTFTSEGKPYSVYCHRSIDPCVSSSASGPYRITHHLLIT